MADHAAAIKMAYQSAEAHLASLKREQAENGLPCPTCRWAKTGSYSWDNVCTHPFLKRGRYDPITGKTTWDLPSHRDARQRQCGQAGILHEPAGLPRLVVRWFVARWYWFFLALGVLVGLSPLLLIR